ncbi:MAG: hypothetical protein H0U76_21940 [Ktedonobacteraceae bacterium]|nr:hypothetical protein [Ktedonobacteraceae bacterium]
MRKQQAVLKVEWISPLEASLEASIRAGILISQDDIKQLRNKGKIPDAYTQRVSNRLTLYSRQYLLSPDFRLPAKRVSNPIEPDHVATWLEEYPQTVARLEQEGFTLPHKELALAVIEERRAGRTNLGGRRKIS